MKSDKVGWPMKKKRKSRASLFRSRPRLALGRGVAATAAAANAADPLAVVHHSSFALINRPT